mgnify:CR=1 FL=1
MRFITNNKIFTIIENGKEIEINYEDYKRLCIKYLANAIAEYDNRHDEKVETKSKEWQIGFGERVIDEVLNALTQDEQREK